MANTEGICMDTPASRPDTETLIREAIHGDASAREVLLARHCGRLERMVALRMDPMVSARVDPADVVQEAMTEAYL